MRLLRLLLSVLIDSLAGLFCGMIRENTREGVRRKAE